MNFRKLKAMLWSMNFSSDEDAKVADFVKEYVNDNDIIVLVEVMKNKKTIELMNELNNYNFYESEVSLGNKIIIGTKREIFVNKIISKIPQVANYSSPNFLHIEVTINSKKYQIIGARIRIGALPSIFHENEKKYECTELDYLQDYVQRKEQFEILANYISDLDNVIVLGDFNNSKIQGDVEDDYKIVKYKYHDKHTKYYNYHIMKDIVGQNDFIIHTPKGNNYSWGLSYNPEIKKYELGYIKNDHIIASKNIEIVDPNYCWKFIEENSVSYIPYGYADKFGRKKVKIQKGTPDHAILSCEIKL